MFWDRTVLRIYQFLGSYINERQRDGAFRDIDPMIVVRAFIGMIIHHSLNNNLWDPQRRLLDITNERAAREFTEILLKGIVAESLASRHEAGEKRAALTKSASTKKKQTR
jgi:hypothetical protein